MSLILMKLFKKFKGIAIGQIPQVAMILVVVGITIGVGVLINANFITQTSNTEAQQAINNSTAALTSLASWQGLWVIVIAAAVIFGLMGLFFAKKKGYF